MEKPMRMAERLGSRILGDAMVEKIAEAKRTGTDRYGKRVLGTVDVLEVKPGEGEQTGTQGEGAGLDALRVNDPNGDGANSVGEIGKMLTENPALLDEMIQAEALRAKPRKTAYAAFLKAEQDKGEQARAEVIAHLETVLAAFAAPAAVAENA